jgi:hypothetical protein
MNVRRFAVLKTAGKGLEPSTSPDLIVSKPVTITK